MAVALDRIEEILTHEFSTEKYVQLVREIFDDLKLAAPGRFREEKSNFSSYIRGSYNIGSYTDPDRNKMVVYAVELQKRTYVESSRSTQRSFAKKLIEGSNANAALIAFYTAGDPKWRLSFVRLDYEMKFENGRMKTAENMTPAKRYSFLVGKDEPCHTAIDRFRRFLEDENFRPTMDEVEEAFSVEAVTKQFFQLYCDKFRQLLIHLEDNPDFVIEAEQHNFTAAQFAKKLMGQIVFLYFLQKKGWLGVKAWPNTLDEKEYKNAYYARGAKSRELIPIVYQPDGQGGYRLSASGLESLSDEDETVLAQCVKGQPWGSGPHNFMRKLFDEAVKRGANFFDDYLEPLFYDALNVNRGEQGYDPALHCRIPFLSGGLFEPIDGYDWKHNDFAIPNVVFSNRINNNPRTGDGILDIFDRYNFTMSEDEPMEREVAVDPEMLGKVFENLLEVNDRKAKGAFYTPREIVHYMCQESLIHYLTTAMGVSEDAIREFILYGDFMKDEDTVKEKRLGNGGMYISGELYLLDKNGKIVVNRLPEMDKALADVRVADPAVGSGAFPLGMLNEIVRARQNISAYMAITMKSNDIRLMYSMDRSPYRLKYETIRNCIYAADLEPSAVDIAQLRLWLALVIDDEINPDADSLMDGHRNPLPLPNLECNILCGNSLVDVFEGIPLINQSKLIATARADQQIDIFHTGFDAILPRLIEAQERLFRCDNTEKKQEILAEIESYRDLIVMSQLKEGGASKKTIAHYQESKQMVSKPYVLWQLDFSRVFREKGGFDIIMGNPPYIQLQKSINDETGEKLGDQYEKLGFESFTKTGDIYCLFYEKGWQLLRENGALAFITSNKWMRAGYGEKIRKFFAEKTNPLVLVDFAGQKIFESATVDVNILLFEKARNQGNTTACVIRDKCGNNLSVYVQQSATILPFTGSAGWVLMSPIEMSIKEKINRIGIPLKDWNIEIFRGILTGYNTAFIIDSDTKERLISEDPRSAELIRPILRGRDIQRYSYDFANLWLISTFPSRQYAIDDYPAIRDYLLSFGKERLEQTGKQSLVNGTVVKARKKTNNKWFETQDSISYWNLLSQQKIIWGEISDKPKFAIDLNGEYSPEATTFMMTGDNLKYLLCFLNSTFSEYFFAKIGTTTGMGTLRWKKYLIETLPVPRVEEEKQKKLEVLLDNMLANPSRKEYYIDRINQEVYSLLNFSKEEIEFIEEMVKLGAH